MSNPQKRKGSRFERKIVDKAQQAGLQAKLQPGSGVYKAFPNDAVIEQTLIEAKTGYVELDGAGEKSFRFQLEWIQKVMQHAKEQNLEGAAVIVQPKNSRQVYALVEFEYLLKLLKRP